MKTLLIALIVLFALTLFGALTLLERYSHEAYDFRWEICSVEKRYDAQATSFVWANGDGTQEVFQCPISAPYHLN